MKTYWLSMLLAVLLAIPAASLASSGLADLATVVDRTSHRASSYDRTGGNTDNITSFEPGQKAVLLDTDGPGVITHAWFTVSAFRGGPDTVLRDLVLRIYWDGSDVPSVEAPIGDFFAAGHGMKANVSSLPIEVTSTPQEGSLDATTLGTELLEIVSDKTGYPAEMLELEMDMEADLGIDSIKRVEILGELQDRHLDLPEVATEVLAELRTLGQILDAISAGVAPKKA